MNVHPNTTAGLRHDRLAVDEGDVRVKLAAFRHSIRVEVVQNGEKQEFVCSLGALASALRLVQPREEW